MPDTGIHRHDDTSSEEESDGEIVITNRRKSFGIRVAQTPQQAQQQVLSQIGNLANERQANEVIVQELPSHEKTEAEKKAIEQHQRMVEAQQLAKAQQAAALQAAAARVAQAQNQAAQQNNQVQAQQEALKEAQERARKAQQEALARSQEAQRKAQEEALQKARIAQEQAQKQAEARQKAQQDALLRAQEAQKKAQDEARKKVQQAQQEAQARAEEQRKARLEEAQKLAQKQAQEREIAQKKAQEEAQKLAQKQAQERNIAQKKAQEEAQKKQQLAQKAQSGSSNQIQKSAQQKSNPQPSNTTKIQPQAAAANGKPQKGALAQSQVTQQEVHAAAPPKWSRAPGKVQTQGPQPEPERQAAAAAPPSGNTALRQTVQIQEKELASGVHLALSPVLARKPQIQAEQLAQKFIEKPEGQLEKLTVQKGQQLEGAKRWAADSELREQQPDSMQQTERGPKAVILADDACWQTQRRVPAEIQQPQVGKIAIPELSEKEVQRTIVAQPASYHKVQWNEFPEEPTFEITASPKTKTQDWVPINNEQNELQRSLYKPARIAAVWPPPQDELVKEEVSPLVVKPNEDTAWIQQDQSSVLKQAVWGKTARINRVWPPPENEATLSDFGPQHMPVVQWPPPEAEAHEREQVEVLQKHIPTKKMERQWPPPPPQYQVVESSGEIETRYNPAEIAEQHNQQQAAGEQQQQIIRTVIRSQ